jgi:phage shock protein PspC (stress-responsive transcriptional regulator)
MQKTVTVHMNGLAFFMDEDAHARLHNYIEKLKRRYGQTEGGDEIVADIEGRLAELFSQRTNPSVGVVTLQMVEEAIQILGEPEQFDDAGESSNEDSRSAAHKSAPVHAPKRLYRDVDSRVLGGVCAGFAAYFGADVMLVRVLTVVLTIITGFAGALVYLLLWIVLPEALLPSQKLEMRGEKINVENIEKAVKSEFEAVKTSFGKMGQSDAVQNSRRYFEALNQRDRTVLIVVGVFVALIVITRLAHFQFLPFFSFPNFSVGGWHWPFSVFRFALPVLLLAIGVGLVHRPLLKPMLWIAGVVLVVMMLTMLFWPMFRFGHQVFYNF